MNEEDNEKEDKDKGDEAGGRGKAPTIVAKVWGEVEATTTRVRATVATIMAREATTKLVVRHQ